MGIFPLKTERGFSLIELLISMAIGLSLIAAISSTFMIQRDSYNIQEQIIEATQTARVALNMLSREIHTAGYDPTGAGFYGITYNSDELRILADLDADGTTGGSNEDITYQYHSDYSQIRRKTGNGSFQPFAENIQNFTFEYLDSTGNATTSTASIRQMRISVTAKTEKPDQDFQKNSGYRAITLTSLITPPNLNLITGL